VPEKQFSSTVDAIWLRRAWRFERTIRIPDSVDTGKLTAEYRNGVLEISAPLKSSAIPKRIEINSAAKAKVATVH
jgi:HSP20 family protein